jgi:hypothetical protein
MRGEKLDGCEVRVRRRDTGKSWIVPYSGSPVYDQQGKLARVIPLYFFFEKAMSYLFLIGDKASQKQEGGNHRNGDEKKKPEKRLQIRRSNDHQAQINPHDHQTPV